MYICNGISSTKQTPHAILTKLGKSWPNKFVPIYMIYVTIHNPRTVCFSPNKVFFSAPIMCVKRGPPVDFKKTGYTYRDREHCIHNLFKSSIHHCNNSHLHKYVLSILIATYFRA